MPTFILNEHISVQVSMPVMDTFLSDMMLKLHLAQDALVSTQAIQLQNVNRKCQEVQELYVGDIIWLNAEHISLKNIPQDMSKKL